MPIFFIYAMNLIFLSSPALRDKVICYLISFAIGGLLGDVFFHTLPHLSTGHSNDHSHDHSHGHGHDHSHEHSDGHGHSHDPEQMMMNLIIIVGIVSFFLIEKVVEQFVGSSHDHGDHPHHSHDAKPVKQQKGKKSKEEEEKEKRYTSYAILTLIGDFLHNFTDGLSIGVAYVASKSAVYLLIPRL